eukprot:CAMPEP_0194284764 /NCGR_PEP_ID=MMETSP0169-20130528/28501_1 /TAXON_ID=218684 /ORGANISM="Corethron pennatum, Strain L29A3" /LENGTH=280 /DNA_ID=CAMNT_0039030679 /DNA_START=120 /DNA_END=962 /DNA_ORIENTATION=-
MVDSHPSERIFLGECLSRCGVGFDVSVRLMGRVVDIFPSPEEDPNGPWHYVSSLVQIRRDIGNQWLYGADHFILDDGTGIVHVISSREPGKPTPSSPSSPSSRSGSTSCGTDGASISVAVGDLVDVVGKLVIAGADKAEQVEPSCVVLSSYLANLSLKLCDAPPEAMMQEAIRTVQNVHCRRYHTSMEGVNTSETKKTYGFIGFIPPEHDGAVETPPPSVTAETVLTMISNSCGGMAENTLSESFGLKDDESKQKLEKTLQNLQTEGMIYQNGAKKYLPL